MRTRRAHIEALLPTVFQRAVRDGSPLAAVLDVMVELHAPAEDALGAIAEHLDPLTAPEPWVPLLARWVGIDFAVTTGVGRLRELVTRAVELAQRRGTAAGLERFLETATGVAGFRVTDRVPDDGGTPRPFHIRIDIPPAALLHRDMIENIVLREKPAYVTYELHPD